MGYQTRLFPTSQLQKSVGNLFVIVSDALRYNTNFVSTLKCCEAIKVLTQLQSQSLIEKRINEQSS